MSLVANYSDSESEEETQESNNKPVQQQNQDSNSDSNSTEEDEEQELQKQETSVGLLANPFRFFGSTPVQLTAQDSVLRVEFREQEAHKNKLMETHVKLSSTAFTPLTINGKKICWNHRKGKCRFGHNCKFAHDSDILTPTDTSFPEKTYTTIEPPPLPLLSPQNEIQDATVFFTSSPHLSGENKKRKPDFLEEEEKKKKRPGLTQTLVPGKKAMALYHHLKHH